MTNKDKREKQFQAAALPDNAGDVAERMVPVSYIRAVFETGSLTRADLIYGEEKGGYRVRVHMGEQRLLVARREGDEPRTWRSVERALSFIKEHFGVVREISLIYPMEEIASCKPTNTK